ncbi:hypothetical protein ACWKWC_00540 [Geodermatophilus nigrescens]
MSRKDSDTTFVGACLAGAALEDDINDWVARWHDAPDGSTLAQLELNEHLGMTLSEYALWVEQPSALRFVIAAHMRQRPVDELLTSRDDYALAARAASPDDALTVLRWLVQTGRVDPERAAHA